MKVLLTGATGFLGRYVLRSLRESNIETVVIGRRQPSDMASGDFIELDLLDAKDGLDVVKATSATHLVHLAWYTEHGKFWTSPQNLRWVEATMNLVEAFYDGGGRHALLIGSCAEYDWSEGYCKEDRSLLEPATLYGISKDATRRLAMLAARQRQLPCAWARVFNPYGMGDARQRLIPLLIDVFNGKRPPLGVNAKIYRDFIHASDVAEGLLTLLRAHASGSYNVCSGEPVAIGDIVQKLAKAMDADPEMVLALNAPNPDSDPIVFGDNHKLRALGWVPRLTLSQGLEQILCDIRHEH
ncbi:NAD-dependent epimerase/dehydratase family protein [Chitinolyticbacter albus]|uniref:NAD-dependent epimerase/dehydratase family protein n=1 Tax=Chitinolyticbacter albus TaxID=2961951 RepID=UPI00210E2F5C|nr:NAD(P)-dependent oxidoreductase [Chitinolyticbacter albus]